jgi:hypothetical protein
MLNGQRKCHVFAPSGLRWPPLLVVLMVCASSAIPASGTEESNGVKILHAVTVRVAAEKKALSISYQYQFPGRETVHIKGLGTVPAKGSFAYITESPSLVFEETPNGGVVATVDLKETVAVAAKPPLNEIPNESEFDPAFRAFPWEPKSSLEGRANVVLGKYFAYQPREIDNVTEFLTTFAPLDKTLDGQRIIGRVAMLLAFPYEKTRAGNFTVRVRTLVQEGRLRSDVYKNAVDQAVLRAATEFVDKVMSEIASEKRG